MFINYAHRGASEYMPENTLSAFYLGIYHRANGIETDVRITADGIPVLFHDDTLQRTAGQPGSVRDYTLEQLRSFMISTPDGGQHDRIVTLEEFCRLFGHRDLHFAVELKENGIEEQVLSLLAQYGMKEKSIITAFEFPRLEQVRRLGDWEIGWLISKADDTAVEKLLSIGGKQICPKASTLTPETVDALHGRGLNVRAWGVSSPELMEAVLDAGADGMTINFPDLLTEALAMRANPFGGF